MKNQILKNRITFFLKTDANPREKVENLLFFMCSKNWKGNFCHRGHGEKKKMQNEDCRMQIKKHRTNERSSELVRGRWSVTDSQLVSNLMLSPSAELQRTAGNGPAQKENSTNDSYRCGVRMAVNLELIRRDWLPLIPTLFQFAK